MSADKSQLKQNEDYLTDFTPEDYLKTTSSNFEDEGGLRKFFFACYNEIYKSGAVKGRRLMDVGTGPIPISVVTAEPYVQEIFFSDYAPSNRDYLYQWLIGSSRQDFKALFQYVTKLENKGQHWEERSSALKNKVGGIFPVDLLNDKVFGENLFPHFDVITSSLTFESAANEVADWEKFAKRLSKFQKPGGHFVINGVMGCTFYNVGPIKFQAFPISKDKLQESFTNAGYTIQYFKDHAGPPKEENVISNYEKGFVMHCIRN
ncbi:hypothetical protein LOTGIDRAFT_172268 [Lottia gigantea]|uniref:NNMT/PNMT/TEMT family protein n=1 Tax=Lottia gigantea TaxID=225164 RepID=V4AWN8_LOTGI|nr:hypothetical protein LOTGIDRAFT_172268 [Lottia gigantea]ESP01893.1 hypothetical protein LOTGIDRAFT_172268 [Lottia gigantea]